jgi:hypothetical protein
MKFLFWVSTGWFSFHASKSQNTDPTAGSALIESRAQHSGALCSVNVAECDAQFCTHLDILVPTTTAITATAVAAVAWGSDSAFTGAPRAPRAQAAKGARTSSKLDRVWRMVNFGRRLCPRSESSGCSIRDDYRTHSPTNSRSPTKSSRS